MLILLLFIFINTFFVGAEEDSNETKYIDLLPEKEKKEFIERIARRILQEIDSNITSSLKSGEVIPDGQLDIHSAYVSKLLKEESENLRRRVEGKNSTNNDTILNTNKTHILTKEINKTVHEALGHKKQESTDKNNAAIDLTLRSKHVADDEDININKKTNPEHERNDEEVNNNKEESGEDRSSITQGSIENNSQERSDVHKNVKSSKDPVIDLTLRQGKNNVTDNAAVDNSSKKKKAVSIEIEIYDDGNYTTDRNKIPVKVVYEDFSKTKKEEIKSTLSTEINKNQSSTTGKSITNDSKHNETYIIKNRRAISNEDTIEKNTESSKFGDLEIKSKVSLDIIQNSDKNTLADDGDPNEIPRKKRTSTDSEEKIQTTDNVRHRESDLEVVSSTGLPVINSSEHAVSSEITTNKEDLTTSSSSSTTTTNIISTPTSETVADESTQASTPNSKSTATTDTEISTTINSEYFTTTDLIKTDETITVTTKDAPVTESKIYHYTQPILEEVGVTYIHDNTSIATLTNNETTTEEIIKARTDIITGYPSSSEEKKSSEETNSTTVTEEITHHENIDSSSVSNKIRVSTVSTQSDSPVTNQYKIRENTEHSIDKRILRASYDESSKQDYIATAKSNNSNSDIIYISNFTPLTTLPPIQPTVETMSTKSQDPTNNSQELQAMEATVMIQNNNVVEKVDSKEDNSGNINIINLPKQALRQGPINSNRKHRSPLRQIYQVYEILPGQNPFVQKRIIQKQKPKLQQKILKKKSRVAPKIKLVNNAEAEEANYAPIYNYAPQFAYYNPKNIYGSNLDDRVTIIQDSYENQSGDKHSEISFEYSNEKPMRSEVKPQKSIRAKHRYKPIDLDYYFGFEGKGLRVGPVNTKIVKHNKKNGNMQGDYNCAESGMCPTKDERVIVQNPAVPPNSDSPEHAHNAVLHKTAPVTQTEQVREILNGLNYFAYYNYKYEDPSLTTTTIRPSGWTTMLYPPIDMLYNKKLRNRNKHLLRTGTHDISKDQDQRKQIKFKVFNSRNQFIDEDGPNAQSRYSYKIPKNLNIRSKRANKTFKYITNDAKKLRKQPLIILTGKIDKSHPKSQIKLGKFEPIDVDYYYSDPYPNRNKRLPGIYYVFGGKKIEKDSEEVEDYDYSDDALDKEDTNVQKILNKEAMQLVLNLTDYDHLPYLYPKLKPKKITKPLPRIVSIRTETDMEPYLTVIKDMIDTDNNAIKKYDWLGTTVDIRSAVAKLMDLSETIRLKDKVHPEDLQLLKYTLYLYKAVKPDKEEISDSGESVPKNMRFLEETQLKEKRKKDDSKMKEPWLSTEGLDSRLLEFEEFWSDFLTSINDLHDAIKHIAMVTKYRSQKWYVNLKDLYLEKPTNKKLLQILLHLTATRLFGLIEDSSVKGMKNNYVSYAVQNPEQVQKATEEFAFLSDVMDKLVKLS